MPITVREEAATEESDARTIERVLKGETHAFRLLVDRYQGPLFGLLDNLLTAADCEDVAQETFLTAFDSLHRYDPDQGRFSTWLLTIGRNKGINLLQKRRPQTVERPPELLDPNTPESMLMQGEWFRRLDAAMAALPLEQRAVFVLADIQELSYEEISRIEGVQMGTVKSRLNRARQKLRALLDEE